MHLNPFDAIEARLHRGQLAAFGECFDFQPRQQRANKPAIADPTRPSGSVRGVFTRPASDVKLKLSQSVITGREPELQVQGCDLPGGVVRQGDVFVRGDGTRFEVTVAHPNGHGTLCVKLVELGIAGQH